MNQTTLDIAKGIVEILTFAVSAISLFVYTQRDRKSFLRININSNKLQFSVDLENIGPSPARIKEIKLERRGDLEKSSKAISLISLLGANGSAPCGEGSTWDADSIFFSNLSGDVISGGGTKHHLFRCQAKNVNSLKFLWETLKDYDMTITYFDVYGLFIWRKRKCKSHFQQDYDSFAAALGNRTAFSDKGNL